jgi:hypothetical protein
MIHLEKDHHVGVATSILEHPSSYKNIVDKLLIGWILWIASSNHESIRIFAECVRTPSTLLCCNY